MGKIGQEQKELSYARTLVGSTVDLTVLVASNYLHSSLILNEMNPGAAEMATEKVSWGETVEAGHAHGLQIISVRSAVPNLAFPN